MSSQSTPVTKAERVLYWDVLRGFAVLGVLMANMPLMSLSSSLDWSYPDPGETPLDRFAFGFVRCFADTKFITIFSALFGAGLAFMSERALRRGAPFLGMWFRRIAIMAVFGLLHVAFLWFGDILTHYAIIGALAVWFRNFTPKTLVVTGLVFLVVGALFSAASAGFEPKPEQEEGQRAMLARAAEVLPSGDFAASMEIRHEFFGGAVILMTVFWGPRTLGLFLLGMALMKTGILLRVQEHRRLAVRALVIGLAVGVPLQIVNVIYAFAGPPEGDDAMTDKLVAGLSLYLVALFLSPAYMGAIALWVQTTALGWLQTRLAAVGRMAFTSYISHSVITTVIFNWCGLYDQWGRFEGLLLTFGIYAFQLWVSPIWLARFRFGPLEWLWRICTYGRRPVMDSAT